MAKKPAKISRSWVPERKSFERERRDTDFDYNGRKWRKVRQALLSVKPFCVDCEADGIVCVATVADHDPTAKVLIARGDDPYDAQWLFPRCKHHHNSKSGREAHFRGGMG